MDKGIAQAMEPVDLSKKKHIENMLVPALDASIVQLAKIRKRQPPKCRLKAREITNNVIQYYSKVCVKSENRLKEQLCSDYQQHFQSTDGQSIPDDLNLHLKVIRKTLANRKDIEQAVKIWAESQEVDNTIKQLTNESLSLIGLQGSGRSSLTGESCFDFHLLNNPDFIVKESV